MFKIHQDGWVEPKFFKRMCHGLSIMKEQLVDFEKEYSGFELKVISDGEIVPLDFYRNN